MEDAWKNFEASGKVMDYLNYCKVQRASLCDRGTPEAGRGLPVYSQGAPAAGQGLSVSGQEALCKRNG